MQRRTAYLLLFVAGIALPYSELIPWVAEHGLNLGLFFEHLFANRISAFFGADVLVSAIVVIVFAAFERRQLGPAWWTPLAAVLTCGVSAGLPLLLYIRERRLTVRPSSA